MINLPLGILCGASADLASLGHRLEEAVAKGSQLHFPKEVQRQNLAWLRDFVDSCQALGLAVTHSFADELFKDISNPDNVAADGGVLFHVDRVGRLRSEMRSAMQCLEREARTKVALLLPPEKVHLYAPAEPLWGSHVRSQFPSATKDIDEAGKCLALGRSTACVFHTMRVLEVSLKAVWKCLGVAPKGRNWGDALNAIRDERLRRTNKWPESDFFQDIYARLDAIKDAWRNSTMHVDSTYNDEDAAVIFTSTKSFMEKISSRMNEDGLPPA